MAAARTVVFLISAIAILVVLFPMLALRLETGAIKRRYFAFLARLLGAPLLIIGAAMLMRIETAFTILGYPGLAILFFLLAAAGAVWLIFTIFFRDQ